MTLVLSRRGLLHLAGRCGADGYRFGLIDGAELIGFIGLRFERFCKRCIGDPYEAYNDH